MRLIERLPESGSRGPACEPIGTEFDGLDAPADEPAELPTPPPEVEPPVTPFEEPLDEPGFPATIPELFP